MVKDLIAARLAAGGQILFEVEDVRLEASTATTRRSRFRAGGQDRELDCDFIAGCDGFHGVCRDADPGGVLDLSSTSTRSPGSASWPRRRPPPRS